MKFKFDDNTEAVLKALDYSIDQALEEAAGELEAQVKRNTAVDTGQLKGSWSHVVDKSRKVAYVGSPEENAIWEEFGTGEYALGGKGRKGGWYIKIGNGKDEIPMSTVEKYHFPIRKGKNGILFAYTKGKRPKRALWNAKFTAEPRIRKIFKDRLKGDLK